MANTQEEENTRNPTGKKAITDSSLTSIDIDNYKNQQIVYKNVDRLVDRLELKIGYKNVDRLY